MVFAIAATFVVAAVSGGIGYAIGSQNSNEKEVASPTATSSTTSEAALSTPLTAADFTLAVLVEEKACFGSAGCNLQVSITPTFLGSTSDLVGRTFKVLYEIAGGEEPILERFTIEGDHFRIDETISVQTASSDDTITAKVNQVIETTGNS